MRTRPTILYFGPAGLQVPDLVRLWAAGKEFPVLELGLNNPLTPDDMIVTGSVFVNDFSEMDIKQGTLSGSFEFDTSFVDSIDFGVQFTDVDNRAAGAVVQRDAWGGVTKPGAIADLMTPANIGNSFNQISGANDPRRQSNFYTYNMAALIARTEQLIASLNYNPIEAYTVIALLFFAFLYPLVQATYVLERRLRQGD